MKKNLFIGIASILIALTVFGCAQAITPEPPIVKMGKFAAKAVSTPRSSLSRDLITFNGGTLKASDTFYFILKNVGTADITNISIVSDDSHFVVTPGTISVLATDATSSVEPLIRIAINHGTVLGEVGYSDLISSGVHNTQVSITGTSEGQPVSLDVDLTTLIQAASWEISYTDSNSEIQIVTPTVDVSYGSGGLGVYLFPNSFQGTVNTNPITLTFKNTGDVPLVFYWDFASYLPYEPTGMGTTLATGTTIQPGESIPLVYGDGFWFHIYTSNAIINQTICGPLAGSQVRMGLSLAPAAN